MVVLARNAKARYMELIEQLPLVPTRSDEHLALAQSVVDDLLQQRLDDGGKA